jgi:hypothetical protein
LFDLTAEVTEFVGSNKMVGLSSPTAGILIADPYTADENWKSKMFALPGKRTVEFAERLLDTIIQARKLYGDEQASSAAARIAESDWRAKLADSRRAPFQVNF